MTLADHARLLVEYNEYANQRVLDAAFGLDDPALDRVADASFGSVRGNLQHVLGAQVTWLTRWTGQQPSNIDVKSREGLRAAYAGSHTSLRDFAAKLTDADWDRVLDYKDTRGVPHAVPLGLLITHAVNHGTLHRGETGMLLAAHNRSPGDLDFVLFVLERATARA